MHVGHTYPTLQNGNSSILNSALPKQTFGGNWNKHCPISTGTVLAFTGLGGKNGSVITVLAVQGFFFRFYGSTIGIYGNPAVLLSRITASAGTISPMGNC